MSKISKKFFLIPLTLFLMFAMLFSLIGCGEEVPLTADVTVLALDKTGAPIANTEILVGGISDKDVMNGYTTNSDGRFTVKHLGERKITAVIHTEEGPFEASYTVTASDLERGEFAIEFKDYEK